MAMKSANGANELIERGALMRGQGDVAQARAYFEEAARQEPGNARAWRELGALLNDGASEYDLAANALDRALALAPLDKEALRARARVEIERGGDSVTWLAKARAAHPDDLDVRLELATARYDARDDEGALGELMTLTRERPDWIKGHSALALLRWQLDESHSLARGYAPALAQDPENKDLWLACFEALLRAPDYEGLLSSVETARKTFGDARFLDRFEAIAASETGDIARADAIFARMGGLEDMEMGIAYIRHALRAKRIAEAARVAALSVHQPGGARAWSYLSTAWRLLGDERWRWLDSPSVVAAVEVDVDIAPLAAVLRRLHTWRCAPLGQSVRGGTQTGGQLFNRPEPEIVKLRVTLEQCIRRFVEQLPPHDAGHPFLGAPRGELGFTGSWSVRLTQAGYHINHTHPQGWLSCVFYVAVPESIGATEADPAGWLTLGQPPPELGLNLEPAQMIKPKPGLMALFPSTMWHGTVPFEAGERLTVAFDVQSRA